MKKYKTPQQSSIQGDTKLKKMTQAKINALHFLKVWYEFRLASLHVSQSQKPNQYES